MSRRKNTAEAFEVLYRRAQEKAGNQRGEPLTGGSSAPAAEDLGMGPFPGASVARPTLENPHSARAGGGSPGFDSLLRPAPRESSTIPMATWPRNVAEHRGAASTQPPNALSTSPSAGAIEGQDAGMNRTPESSSAASGRSRFRDQADGRSSPRWYRLATERPSSAAAAANSGNEARGEDSNTGQSSTVSGDRLSADLQELRWETALPPLRQMSRHEEPAAFAARDTDSTFHNRLHNRLQEAVPSEPPLETAGIGSEPSPAELVASASAEHAVDARTIELPMVPPPFVPSEDDETAKESGGRAVGGGGQVDPQEQGVLNERPRAGETGREEPENQAVRDEPVPRRSKRARSKQVQSAHRGMGRSGSDRAFGDATLSQSKIPSAPAKKEAPPAGEAEAGGKSADRLAALLPANTSHSIAAELTGSSDSENPSGRKGRSRRKRRGRKKTPTAHEQSPLGSAMLEKTPDANDEPVERRRSLGPSREVPIEAVDGPVTTPAKSSESLLLTRSDPVGLDPSAESEVTAVPAWTPQPSDDGTQPAASRPQLTSPERFETWSRWPMVVTRHVRGLAAWFFGDGLSQALGRRLELRLGTVVGGALAIGCLGVLIFIYGQLAGERQFAQDVEDAALETIEVGGLGSHQVPGLTPKVTLAEPVSPATSSDSLSTVVAPRRIDVPLPPPRFNAGDDSPSAAIAPDSAPEPLPARRAKGHYIRLRSGCEPREVELIVAYFKDLGYECFYEGDSGAYDVLVDHTFHKADDARDALRELKAKVWNNPFGQKPHYTFGDAYVHLYRPQK